MSNDLDHSYLNDSKDAHYKGARQLGRGLDYQYPHNFSSGWVKHQYLPDTIKNAHYYQPKTTGKFEALKQIYDKMNEKTPAT